MDTMKFCIKVFLLGSIVSIIAILAFIGFVDWWFLVIAQEEYIECSPRLYTGYVEWDDMQKAKAFSSYIVACRWAELVEESRKDKWVKRSGVELH